MILIPLQSADHQSDALIVIIDSTTVTRLREHDPADISLHDCGKRLVNPQVLLCYEDSGPELDNVLHSGDYKAIIAYLNRGWKFRPGLGDHDRGPEKLGNQN